MALNVLTLEVELRFPHSLSLKAKRAILRPIVEGARNRFAVAIAEVDHQDSWQRATLGVAAVSGESSHVVDIVDKVDRFIWSHTDVEILSTSRHWLEAE
jgi:uncharacterized protein YlxP (DUF503 family)